MTWDGRRLAAELAEAPDVGAAARLVVARLRAQGGLLPSVYVRQGDRLRCVAVEGYWQTFDGIAAGAGVIGRTFASGTRTMLRDVANDEHYLPAAPDVVDELSVPLVVDGTTVGVLNVESTSRLEAAAERAIDEAAGLLVTRLHQLPLPVESAAQKIGRHAAVLDDLATRSPSVSDGDALHEAVLSAAVDISGLETAVLVLLPPDSTVPQIAAATGPLAEAFRELPSPALEGIASFVETGSSAYTVSSGAGLPSPLHTSLREAGAASLLVLPLGSADSRLGLLLVASTAVVPVTTVDAQLLELLAAEVVSCLRLSDSLRELRERADRDALTGLGHHAAFHARLPAARSATSAERLAVLYIDVDHFKQVNDNRGHAAGDRLLTAITSCLAEALRSSDRLYRIGGDEFAALVEVTGEQHAVTLAQRLLERVVASTAATLSIGVAVATDGESDAALLARADAALYAAKAAGRCTVRLHRATRST